MEALLTKTHSGSRECLVGRLLNAVEYNNANDSENDTSNAVRASESFCRNAAHSLARFVESVRIFEQRQWSSTSIRCTTDSMIRLNRELIAHFFLPSGPNCSRKLHKSSASFSFLIPGNTILVPGIFALGSLMYSLKVASSQTIPEFLFASE